MGRNILINPQLKRILFLAATGKNKTKLRKTEKKNKKKNNTNESDFSENEILDLNSFKPFEFEPKRNVSDNNSSSIDHEEEGAEYKVKLIRNK